MNFRFQQIALAVLGSGLSAQSGAQQAAATAPAPVTGPLSSLIIGMALVLAVIAAAAWLVRRLAPRTCGGPGALRVIAGAAVGQRERVVIVEIGSTWLIVGVAPGCVNTLHQMPRLAGAEAIAAPAGTTPPFAQWLKKFSGKRGET
jgi:flagellar protein FliO/FliZ